MLMVKVNFKLFNTFRNSLKFPHITDSCSTSNIFIHRYNIIIDLAKDKTQKIHAGILVPINVRLQVGDLTWKFWKYSPQWRYN